MIGSVWFLEGQWQRTAEGIRVEQVCLGPVGRNVAGLQSSHDRVPRQR